MEDIKEALSISLSQILNKSFKEIFDSIETPKDKNMGDFSFPCFKLSKELKKSPNIIAEDIAISMNKIVLPKGIAKIHALGSYINFYVNNLHVVKKVLEEILDKKSNILSQKRVRVKQFV